MHVEYSPYPPQYQIPTRIHRVSNGVAINIDGWVLGPWLPTVRPLSLSPPPPPSNKLNCLQLLQWAALEHGEGRGQLRTLALFSENALNYNLSSSHSVGLFGVREEYEHFFLQQSARELLPVIINHYTHHHHSTMSAIL